MGFADLVQAEETVSIKISEYRELIENNTIDIFPNEETEYNKKRQKQRRH